MPSRQPGQLRPSWVDLRSGKSRRLAVRQDRMQNLPQRRTDSEVDVDAYLRGESTAVATVSQWLDAELQSHRTLTLAEREELSQDVHGKLLANLTRGEFRRESALRTYVVSITRFTTIDRLRSRSRREESLESDVIDLRRSPEEAVARSQELELMGRTLARTPKRCRRLLTLIFAEGLDYETVGERLGIPVGTVKSRVWNCRQRLWKLRRRLERRER